MDLAASDGVSIGFGACLQQVGQNDYLCGRVTFSNSARHQTQVGVREIRIAGYPGGFMSRKHRRYPFSNEQGLPIAGPGRTSVARYPLDLVAASGKGRFAPSAVDEFECRKPVADFNGYHQEAPGQRIAATLRRVFKDGGDRACINLPQNRRR